MTKNALLVAGTGPVGLAAALALAEAGRQVLLVGPVPAENEMRTTALMLPAVSFLEKLGFSDVFAAEAAPLLTMRIVDITGRLVRSPTVTFRAFEIGEPAFGYNIPNRALTASLAAAVAANPAIKWHKTIIESWRIQPDHVDVTLADGSSLQAELAIAADGRNSPARQAAGISVKRKDLDQAALVLNFGHSRHHESASTEFHTPQGPCTQVPLPGGFRSSLVWVMSHAQAAEYQNLSDTDLAERLEARQQSFLGRVMIETGRQIFPLTSILPQHFAARRIFLAGEAAHVFPPITAQGLNLGLRDVMELADIFSMDPGKLNAEDALRRYDARRRTDIVARAGAVNLVNTTLLSNSLPAQLMRSAGLGLMSGLPLLRGFFMREGMHPGSGSQALMPTFLRRQ